MKALLLAVVVVMVGCSQERNSLKSAILPSALGGCPDAADSAVLNKLYRAFPQYGEYDAEFGRVTTAQLDEEQSDIDTIRAWAKTTVTDECVRSGYTNWLDYYEHELKEAREELRTHTSEREYQQYTESRKREDKAVEEFEQTHQVPAPPSRTN